MLIPRNGRAGYQESLMLFGKIRGSTGRFSVARRIPRILNNHLRRATTGARCILH
jgi:hypothetical protein